MANLKGSTFEKQMQNAFYRLKAFGEKKHGMGDHRTYSTETAKKRQMISKDIVKHFRSQGIHEGKINQLLTTEQLGSLLHERLNGREISTQESYIRTMSSFIQGLQEQNITLANGVNREYFDQKCYEYKDQGDRELPVKEGRYIDQADRLIEKLYEHRFESGVIAQIQHELGVRISEAYKIVSEPEKYIVHNKFELQGLIGKGNHMYKIKEISPQLVRQIEKCQKIPSQSTYNRDLKRHGDFKSHDFRFSYAKDQVDLRLAQGMDYRQALKEVSEEMNHKREDVTTYYLIRA